MLNFIRNLRVFYLLAIATVVLLLALNQWTAMRLLRKQEADGQVVNIAGRQRMLSQRLSKLTLLYGADPLPNTAPHWEKEFGESLQQFKSSHTMLREGDAVLGPNATPSDTVRRMFAELDRHYLPLVNALEAFREKTARNQNADEESKQVLRYEQGFLQGMDAIVFQYARESKAKIEVMQRWERLLLLFALLVLGLEVLFIFRPLFVKLEHTLFENAGYQETLKQIAERNRIAKEAAEAESRAKSVMLTKFADDLRTPMNGVLSMADLLAYTPLDKTQQAYLHSIRASADTLYRVLNDLLEFSDLDLKGIQLQLQQYNLRTLVEETLDLLSPQAENKELELLYYWDNRIPENLRFDSTRLRQVLLHLVGKALKFTHKGSVELFVQWLSEDETHVKLMFQVVDTGIGIPEDRQAQLFLVFAEADNKSLADYTESGLGLAISSRMLKAMDGELRVESTPGRGSVFYFSITLEKIMPAPRSADIELNALHGRHVLIVDDSPASQKLLHTLCAQWGMSTHEAATGEEALAIAAELDPAPDFVLMDCLMPEMADLGLRRALGSLPGYEHARFILLSGSAMKHVATRDYFHEVVSKPVKHLFLKSVFAGKAAE